MDNEEYERLKEALSQRDIKLPRDDAEPDTKLSTVDLSGLGNLGGYGNMTVVASTSSWGSFTIPSLTSSLYNGAGIITTNNITGAGSGYNWTAPPTTSGKIEVNGDDGDILIQGRSLKEFMEKMESRLAILVPDPDKLEHFEALKRAYEHYKILEALCEVPKPEDK